MRFIVISPIRFSKRASKKNVIDPESDLKAPEVHFNEITNLAADTDLRVSKSVMAANIEKELERKRQFDEGRAADFARMAQEATDRKKEQEDKKGEMKNTVKSVAIERLGYKTQAQKNLGVLKNAGRQSEDVVTAALASFAKLEDTDEEAKKSMTDAKAAFDAAAKEYEAVVVAKEKEWQAYGESEDRTAEDLHEATKKSPVEVKEYLSTHRQKADMIMKAGEVRDLYKATQKAMASKEKERNKTAMKDTQATGITSAYNTKLGNEIVAILKAELTSMSNKNNNVQWSSDHILTQDEARPVMYSKERGETAVDRLLGMEYIKDQKLYMTNAMRPTKNGLAKPYATIPFVKQAVSFHPPTIIGQKRG